MRRFESSLTKRPPNMALTRHLTLLFRMRGRSAPVWGRLRRTLSRHKETLHKRKEIYSGGVDHCVVQCLACLSAAATLAGTGLAERGFRRYSGVFIWFVCEIICLHHHKRHHMLQSTTWLNYLPLPVRALLCSGTVSILARKTAAGLLSPYILSV